MTAKANRSVTVPIRELCDMTEKVAGGDFSVRTKEVESDEIAVLSRSFNDMTKQIGWLVEAFPLLSVVLKKLESAVTMCTTSSVLWASASQTMASSVL